MSLGNNIYQLRTGRGLSQGDLADALQVSRQSISKWEVGGAVPDLDKLLALSDLFGVTLDELVRGEVPESVPETPAAQSQPEAEAAAAAPDTAEDGSGEGGSIFKTVLICVLVILGLLMLPAIFFSPSSWPGILLWLVVIGLGYAIWTRIREREAAPPEQEAPYSRKKKLRLAFLFFGVLLILVLGLIFTLYKPTPYAQAADYSAILPKADAPIIWTAFHGGRQAISYTLKNTSSEDFIISKEKCMVEIKQNGKWHLLKELSVPSYIEETFWLDAGESHSSHFYFHQIYGRLKPGEYRLVFYVYSRETPPAKKYWIAKEFTIQ